MLHYLKEVSQRMLSRTTEIEKQVNTLVYETKVCARVTKQDLPFVIFTTSLALIRE